MSGPHTFVYGEHEPAVTITVPCFNHGRFLWECVESVLAQTFTGWSLVIVDDGSTDDSHAIASTIPRANRDRRINVIRHARNLGSAAARNSGVSAHEALRPRWIVPLDADDMLEPNHLERRIAGIGGAGWAYCDYTYIGLNWNEQRVRMTDDAQDGIYAGNSIAHGGSLITAEMFHAIGGYCEGLRHSEDWDLWIRATAAGYRARRVPELLYRYRRHPDTKSVTGPSGSERTRAIHAIRPEIYDG